MVVESGTVSCYALQTFLAHSCANHWQDASEVKLNVEGVTLTDFSWQNSGSHIPTVLVSDIQDGSHAGFVIRKKIREFIPASQAANRQLSMPKQSCHVIQQA